jgi:hypothetical protein
MAVALAYTPKLNDWVEEVLGGYTEIFDSIAADVEGEVAEPDGDSQTAMNSLMRTLRNHALNSLE